MRKIVFKTVEKWIKAAQMPLKDEYLEQFQKDYFGEHKHTHYRFFYYMAQQMKPKLALELGVDHGHTLVHIAKASPATMVLGFDKRMHCADERYREFANIKMSYLDTKDMADLLGHFTKEYGKIGIVFQDSSHHYESSKLEFEICSNYLDKNAIWVCDDVTPDFHDPNVDPQDKGMVEYFNELPGQKMIYDDIHIGTKVGVALIA